MPNPNELAPLTVIPGALRFNTDSMKLEYYRGGPVGFGTTTQTGEWVNLTTDSPDIQTGGARGVFGAGFAPAGGNLAMDYITISTTGNAINFGNALTTFGGSSCASSTRGVFFCGSPGINNIEYITISSTGNAIDFGDVTELRLNNPTSVSNSTRGIRAGGMLIPAFAMTNTIDYITIASTGNAQDFGDTTSLRARSGSFASSTRGIFGGGYGPSPNASVNVIDFITISTLGNAADFGDLINAQEGTHGGCSSAIRGIRAGGGPGTYRNVIEFLTIATLGNTQDFGDLSVARPVGACASSTRGVFGGGYVPSPTTFYNTIEYVTIMSTGNAIDFGDLVNNSRHNLSGCSNGHGGLG